MVISILFLACLAVGFLLYAPFMLWFRHRRSRGESMGAAVRFARTGVVLTFAMLAALFGGLATRDLVPDSWLARQIPGEGGVVRWAIFVVVAFGVLERVLRLANIALQHEPPKDAAVTAEENPAAGLLRRWKIATIRGVPLFVDAVLPLNGLLVAGLAGSGLAGSLSYCLAFVALILVHELGHFAAARALGLKVFAINISGLGGSCLTQVPRDVKGTFLLFSAGLAAQAVLLLLTLAAVAVLGDPESPVGQSLYITFTVVNLVIAAINLIPGKTADNLSTDGAILWGLLRHVAGGTPHPLAPQHAASPVFPSQTRLTAIDGMVPPGFQSGVELLNDDKTPMEFVVAVLERHLKLDRESAIAAMLKIHAQGGLLLPLVDPAQAAKVASEVTREAREQGHPLVCRAVEASSGAGATG